MFFAAEMALVAPNFCGMNAVDITVPDAANQAVPYDIRPAIVWGPGCLPADYQATITDSEGTTWMEEAVSAEAGVWWASEILELPPEQEMVLALTPTGDTGSVVSIPFKTHTEPMTGVTGSPNLELGKVHSPRGSITGDFTVFPAADPDTLSLVTVAVKDDPAMLVFAGLADANGTEVAGDFGIEDTGQESLCLTVTQWDAQGKEVGSEDICEQVGCSLSGTSAAWMPLLVGMGVFFQRRSSCF